jgi:hypothetical protein
VVQKKKKKKKRKKKKKKKKKKLLYVCHFNMKKLCALPAESLSVLHVAVTTSSHDFPLQHELLGFSNRERSVYTALCVRTESLYTTDVNRGLHCCNTGYKT